MSYIRTIKSNYDLDIVIDVTDNQDFVQTSGLDWIDIGDQSAENGNYYHEGSIISVDSDNYSVIENIIFEAEEPERIERDRIKAEEDAALLAYLESDEFLEEIKLTEGYIAPEEGPEFTPPATPPDPLDAAAIAAAEASGAVDPRTLELPAPPVFDTPEVINEEVYQRWLSDYNNISVLSNALVSASYNEVSENVVIFTPGLEFPDGNIQTHFPFPEATVEDYAAYVASVKLERKRVLDIICEYLGKPQVD